MVYSRGNKGDYDTWAASGLEGWSHDEVLPYFIKAEDMQDMDLLSDGNFDSYSRKCDYFRWAKFDLIFNAIIWNNKKTKNDYILKNVDDFKKSD